MPAGLAPAARTDSPLCSPPPRSAHQAVYYKGYLYMWGGELTSPNQARRPVLAHVPAAVHVMNKALCRGVMGSRR